MPSEQDKRVPEVGERWAYRARAVARLDEVEVVRFGSKSPPRVLIRFVAPEHEGREDWVPPGRIKVPWEQQEAFLTQERQWAGARAVAYLRKTAVGRAIGLVFDNLPDWGYARLQSPAVMGREEGVSWGETVVNRHPLGARP